DRPVAGEELASVLRSETMRLPGRFETLASLESAAISIINYGYPDDYYASFGARIAALDESTLTAAGQRFVRPDDLVWVVVADLRQIEAEITHLGFGEVVRIDADGNVLR